MNNSNVTRSNPIMQAGLLALLLTGCGVVDDMSQTGRAMMQRETPSSSGNGCTRTITHKIGRDKVTVDTSVVCGVTK